MEVPAQSGVRSYIDIYTTKGPDYGNVRISIEGKTVAEIRGYSPAIIPGGKVSSGRWCRKIVHFPYALS